MATQPIADNRVKKRTRRGKNKKPQEITIFYSNINGLKSKQESVKQIIENLSPEIVLLCETKLPSDQIAKKTLPQYEVSGRPVKSGQSGLAIGVKKQTFSSVLDVTSTSHPNILVTRIQLDNCATRIILGYAPQETEIPDVREHFYTELEIEVTECKVAGDIPVIAGDMNAKLKKDAGNTPLGISSNGKLLAQVVENQGLEVLNFDERCEGKWTHTVRTTLASSVLDYIMITNDLSKHLMKMIIDEECLYCPFGIKRKNKEIIPQYSDHNSIITTFKLPHSRSEPKHQPSWKMNVESLQKFNEITASADFPNDIDKHKGIDKYNEYEKLIFRTMDTCFQKTKKKKKQNVSKKYVALYKKVMLFAKRGKSQRKVACCYIQAMKNANLEAVAKRNRENIKNTLSNLTVDGSFSPNNFWELCKKSRQNNNTMGTSVITEAGNEVFGEDLIKNTYMREFKHRLREREISPDLINYQERTKLICKLYVEQSKTVKMPDYSKEEFNQALSKLKKKKSCGRDKIPPEILLNWGYRLKVLSLKVMNAIKNSQEVPNQWLNVLISTLYKNKGSKKMLVNQRGIFLKQILSKIFERLNMNRIESNIKKIDVCQAGSRINRSPADQTFLLRGCTDHAKYMNGPVNVVLYDYAQCFDSLWLEDCLLSLWKLGVQSEVLNLIRELNKQANIIVKAPLGKTEEFTVTNIVQQGSVCGGVLCSAATAEVGADINTGGTQIGTATVKALVYVDDIASINIHVGDVYNSHEKVKHFSKKKRLSFGEGKCIVLCVNLKPSDVTPRLYIDNKPLPVKDVAVYLGDNFNSKGTNTDLVEARVKKGKGCIVSSMALCSDVTMGAHAVETLLLMYQSLFLPVVLYNSQAWSNLTKTDISALQRIQLKFIKRIFHAPSSTSNPITFLETGILPIKYEIHIKQLGFLHHILTLPDDDIVNHTYKQQLQYPAPNWANEVAQLRTTYNITETDNDILSITKDKWKTIVKRNVANQALSDLCNEASSQKHAQNLLPYQNFICQQYIHKLPPAQCRKIFHIRSQTVDLYAV